MIDSRRVAAPLRVDAWSWRRSSSRRHARARLQLRADRRRAGLEPRVLRRLPSERCRRSATSGSRSAVWSPLKTHEILAVLAAVDDVRDPRTELHLLGVTRCEHMPEFRQLRGHELRQHLAVSAGVQGRPRQLLRPRSRIRGAPRAAGRRQREAAGAGSAPARSTRQQAQTPRAGRAAAPSRAFDRGEAERRRGGLGAARVRAAPRRQERTAATRTERCSTARPWKDCDCAVCQDVGIQVMLFRGTERNKRRGFHNLHVFARRLDARNCRAEPTSGRRRG